MRMSQSGANFVLSTYTKVIDFEDGVIIYNTITGNRSYVYDKDILNQIYTLQTSTLSECEIAPLLREGFCVEEDIEELSVIKNKIAGMHDSENSLVFIMMPTLQCNFNCIYCYEKHEPGFMSDEILSCLYQSIVTYDKEYGLKYLSIVWFGGEPTLFSGKIVEFNKKVRAYCSKNDIVFESGMTTNGFLLNRETSTKFLQQGITNYQITIDGGKETHNTYRATKAGSPTWETIVSNLEIMKSYDIDFDVMIRVNYNFDVLMTVDELFDTIKTRLDDPRFSVLFHSIGCWGGSNDGLVDTIPLGYQSYIIRQLVDRCLEYGIRCANLRVGGFASEVCYAGKTNNYVVYKDGSLGKCTMYTTADQNEKNAVGSIRTGRLVIHSDKIRQWVESEQRQLDESGCYDCFFYPCCLGNSCSKARMQVAYPVCSPTKEVLDDLITLQCRAFLKNQKITQRD